MIDLEIREIVDIVLNMEIDLEVIEVTEELKHTASSTVKKRVIVSS